MSTFIEAEHPRAHTGQFAPKQNSAPAPLVDPEAEAIARQQQAADAWAAAEALAELEREEELEARLIEAGEAWAADVEAGLVSEPDFTAGTHDWESLGTPF